MANRKRMRSAEAPATTPTMVHPGERGVLLSHHEYRMARSSGQGLENYDLLMRRPDDAESAQDETPESARWLPVRADKYLKHRATGWREAGSMDELPEHWHERAQGRELFPPESKRADGGD